MKNSKAASILSLARSSGLKAWSHEKIRVPGPKGSDPVPQKVCQYATAKRKCSLRVIFPINFVSYDVQELLLYNPVLHGVESIRLAFFNQYFTLQKINILYLYFWALSAISLGLALHVKFAMRLKAK